MDWRYIAGFVDGEGSITKNSKGYRLHIPQTHYAVLAAIKDFSGVGNIFKVTKRRDHWKESWVYFVASQENALFFISKILPFLIVKKEVALKAIQSLKARIKERRQAAKNLQIKTKKCKLLRSIGYSYRQIGAALNMDHGHARRLILFKATGKDRWYL